MEIVLNGYKEYLGTKDNDNLAIFNSGKIKKLVPIYEIDNVYVTEGNSISTSALVLCALYDIPFFVISQTGKLLSANIPFNENIDSRVETRLAQYNARNSEKGTEIAKSILLSKINNQKSLLQKHNYELKTSFIEKKINKIKGSLSQDIRVELNVLEGKISKLYFEKYFNLIPNPFKPPKREKYKAQNKTNNLLNLGYEILGGEIYKAIVLSHLDPYLGYLHSEQYSKPSLICDLQEPFRCFIEDFLISYILKLDPKDSFEMKGERTFLIPTELKNFVIALTKSFNKQIDHQRIKNFGKKAKIKTVIKEEPLKLAQYLRDEKTEYTPFLLI